MFGILNLLFCLGCAGYGAIKNDREDFEARKQAILRGDDCYFDHEGKSRYAVDNTQFVLVPSEDGTHMVEYIPSTGQTRDRMKEKRDAEIKEILKNPGNKTVYLSNMYRGKQRDENGWKGFEYTDIKTGRKYFNRTLNVNCSYDVTRSFNVDIYVDPKTDKFVRLNDRMIDYKERKNIVNEYKSIISNLVVYLEKVYAGTFEYDNRILLVEEKFMKELEDAGYEIIK